MKIPSSPDSDGEVFTTPNSTMLDESNKDEKYNSEFEEIFSTPVRDFPMQRRDRIYSMGNLSMNYCYEIYDDTIDTSAGFDDKFTTPNNSFNLTKRKSLSNLSAYEKEFGNTPIDLLKLKKEFETKRFSRARIKSLTNLTNDDLIADEIEIDKHEIRRIHPLYKQESDNTINYFNNINVNDRKTNNQLHRNTFHSGKYKKKIGIGDTKYIGNNEDNDENFNTLIKMNSMSTIPCYDSNMSPIVARKSNGNADNPVEPFKRAYRRSYHTDGILNNNLLLHRQSDGLSQLNNLRNRKDVNLKQIENIDGGRHRSSIHNLHYTTNTALTTVNPKQNNRYER